MKRTRWFVGFVVSAGAGFTTPRVVPQAWLSYILGTALFLVIVWAALAAGSAKGGDDSSRGLRRGSTAPGRSGRLACHDCYDEVRSSRLSVMRIADVVLP
jgi:hypothetical protein